MKLFTTSILFFLFSITIIAQSALKTRPKVAVVLSGGGAKGMAHIGVLKAMEEAGLQPDIITGTSMGSIIGGLYSIGYSADELLELVSTTDWDKMLSNQIPLNHVVMEEKTDYGRYLIELPIKNGKINLPSGVIEGQKLSMLFSGLTWQTAGIESFDNFPIPFRCVGVDIISGEIIEFKDGDLTTAMRASMAIPSIFSPVLIDSTKLVVDGGVLRNFPVQEAINMGADIIIGLYSGFKDEVSVDDLVSLTSVLSRTTLLVGVVDSKNQAKLTDYLITPDLSGINTSDFNKGQLIAQQGKEAGNKYKSTFKRIADSLNLITEEKTKIKLEIPDSLYITQIEITHLIHTNEELILGKAGLEPNMWITREKLHHGLDEIFGTLYFDKISYRFKKHADGLHLILDVKEKPQGVIKASIHYDNYYETGITLGYTHKNLFLSGSRFYAGANISKYPQFKLSYNKYSGTNQKLLVSYNLNISKNYLPYYNKQNSNELGQFDHWCFFNELSISQSFGLNNQTSLGVYHETSMLYPSQSLRQLEPKFDFDKLGYGTFGLNAKFMRNNLNNNLYPTKGLKLIVFLKQTFSPDIYYEESTTPVPSTTDTDANIVNPYFKSLIDLYYYQPTFKNTILTPQFTLGFTSKDVYLSDYYYIGGYDYNLRNNHISFLGFGLNEVYINNFVKVGFGVKQVLFNNFGIITHANWITGADNFIDIWDSFFEFQSNKNAIGYGGGITYRSRLGPLSFLVGGNTRFSGVRYYLNLGFNFSGKL